MRKRATRRALRLTRGVCSLLTPRYDDAEYANNPKAGQVPKLASGMKAHTALVPGRSANAVRNRYLRCSGAVDN